MDKYLITPSGRRNLEEENLNEGDPDLEDLYGELKNLQYFLPDDKEKFFEHARKNKATYIKIAQNIQKLARKL